MRAGLIAVAVLLTVAGASCGPVPQPFRPPDAAKTHNEFLLAPGAGGMAVRQIRGPAAWVGRELADAIAAQLRGHGLLAGAGRTNRHAPELSADGYRQQRDGADQLVLQWTLKRPDGALLRRFETRIVPPAAFWDAPDRPLFETVARELVTRALGQIEARPLPARIGVFPVEGTGDTAGQSLKRHLEAGLDAYGIAVTTTDRADLFVLPDILMQPSGPMSERIEMRWIIIEADGSEVGRVDQAETVAADSDLAVLGPVIARAAVPGIVRLVRDWDHLRASGRRQPN